MDVGVIGVGIMGKNHARIYSESKNVDSVSVYDVNVNLAHAVAEKNNATVYSSLEGLLNHVDAVSVCVPTQFHYSIAHEVMEHNVHMLLEKPVSHTISEGEALLSELPKGLITGVGHIERFNPVVSEIKKMIKSPLYIEAKRHNPTSSRITGSSVVEDLMIHDIDIILDIFPKSNFIIHSAGNLDICSAMLFYENFPIYLSASRKSSKKIRIIYIEEEDFTIEGNFMAQEIFIYRKPGQYSLENERYVQENIIEKVLINKLEPLKVELEQFLKCVKTHTPFPISLNEGVRNLYMCKTIQEQMNR